MSKFTDHLWRDLVREHGPTLAHADRPEPGRARRPRPRARILAGSTLGLASVGAALTLALSGSATSPAFAVTTHHDGSVSVKIYRRSGIAGANRKLAAMGIHERLFAVRDGAGKSRTLKRLISLPQSCLQDQQTGRVVVTVFASAAAQKREIVNGTYIPPSTAGNTGGVPNNGPWHVIACPVANTGNTGSGNTGNTGDTGAG